MNSFKNNDWKNDNFDSLIKSTEYDNILVNKNIDNYFNEIINKPILSQQVKIIPKTNYNFDKFYYDYIEHNLLFIFLLVGIIIFLIIQYYCRDFYIESYSNENNNLNIENKENIKEDKYLNKEKYQKEKIKQLKKIQKLQQIKLLKYKEQLDQEKNKILSIIDELSSINENEYNKNFMNSNYLNQDINMKYADNYVKSQLFFNQIENYDKSSYNSDDNSQYCNVNINYNDQNNYIDDIYVNPPFK